MSQKSHQGLFIGLVTLDLVYLVKAIPQSDQKIVAADYTIAAGGPATNAAVTFCYLGNQAKLLGVVGAHPLANIIFTDLERYQVTVEDLNPSQLEPPSVSSVMITQATGERAVVSMNAIKTQVTGDAACNILHGVDIVLIDGHQMMLGKAIAQQAKANSIPVVIDGGSWKPGFEQVLPFVDYAVCSANFYPPGCNNTTDVFAYLASVGIPHIAITHGENPIQYRINNQTQTLTVPKVNIVDTLGAGDIFHGAFCHYILQTSFSEALAAAARVAATSCQFFGTRRWMDATLDSFDNYEL